MLCVLAREALAVATLQGAAQLSFRGYRVAATRLCSAGTDGAFVEITLAGKPKRRTRGKVLDGEQEAKIIALRLGRPPAGFANWTLRLLAEQAVTLEIVESVSHETLRRTLKKTS